jgi:hypothetical protein
MDLSGGVKNRRTNKRHKISKNKNKKQTKKKNKTLMAWVTFVKKVAKEEKLPYRDAMMRAKVRKNKGEKWMKGGDPTVIDPTVVEPVVEPVVAPVDPADPTVVAPVDPSVVAPVDPSVVAPVDPSVVAPVDPSIVEPVDPTVVAPTVVAPTVVAPTVVAPTVVAPMKCDDDENSRLITEYKINQKIAELMEATACRPAMDFDEATEAAKLLVLVGQGGPVVEPVEGGPVVDLVVEPDVSKDELKGGKKKRKFI